MRIFDSEVWWIQPTDRSRPHSAIYNPEREVYVTSCDKEFTATAIKDGGGDIARKREDLKTDAEPCSLCARRHSTLAAS